MPIPKVSVIVPSYNRADFLPMTIDSILEQSFQDFELIFIDDGSTDDTENIMQRYCERDSRVKYFKQANSERAVARSFGLGLALADYICLVDSDDLWYPHKLKTQVDLLDRNSEIAFCYASVNRIDFDNNPLAAASRQLEGFSGHVYFDLLMRNFIPSVTPMFRKSALQAVGDQVTEYIPYEDWDFWLRFSRQGKFMHIEEPLGDYRIHPGQSVQNVNAERVEQVTIAVLDANTRDEDFEEYNSKLPEDASTQAKTDLGGFRSIVKEAYSLAYLRLSYWYIMAGKPELARKKLAISMQFSSKRSSDYRWLGLQAASYTSEMGLGIGEQVKKTLASFH